MARHAFKTDGTRIGTVLMIFAALFYSGMSISIKLSAADLTVWQTAIGRFALGASFLGGLAVILIRRLGRVNNPFTIYYYFCMIGGLICIWPLLFQDAPILPASRVGWLGFIAVALFAIIAQILMTYGMKYLNAPKTGVLLMIEPVAATTFGTLYLGEPLSFRFICGAGLIFGCGLFLILLPTRSAESG